MKVHNINRREGIRWHTACLTLVSGLAMLFVLFRGLSRAAPFQQGSLVTFEDVTDAAGVGMVTVQWGAEWGDYDGDGDQDLYVGNHFYTPNLYRNNGNGSFTDVREQAGLEPGIDDWHGSAWGDHNDDGALDLYVTAGRATNGSNLYTNNNDGTFSEIAASAGVLNDLGRGRSPRWVDYDRDGDLDIHIANSDRDIAPDALYRNNGNGTFTDVAAAAGLALTSRSEGSAWTDYDNDGYDDIIIIKGNPQGPLLFRNQGNRTFVDVTTSAGIVKRWEPLGAAWGDYGNDGYQDLYISYGYHGYEDTLDWDDQVINSTAFVRAGQEEGLSFTSSGDSITFDLWLDFRRMYASEVFLGAAGQQPLGMPFTLNDSSSYVGRPSYTPGIDFGAFIWRDVSTGQWQLRWSNDGKCDKMHGVMTSNGLLSEVASVGFDDSANIARANTLYRNNGDGTFEDVTATAGVGDTRNARQVNWIDYENDGDLDIYVVNAGTTVVGNEPNILYQNNGDGTFTDVTTRAGLLGPTYGYGDCAAWADYTGDGFLDMFLTNGTWDGYLAGPHKLYLNGGSDNHWLEIKLIGTGSNRLGFGTKIQVKTGDVIQSREVGVSTSGPCHDSLLTHFGLGSYDRVEVITITWPSGQQQVLRNIPSDTVLSVVERTGDVTFVYLPLILKAHQ